MSELTKEDLEALERIKAFEAEMDAIPESEKQPLSEELLDRMQSEAETNALMPEESREFLRKIMRGEN